MQRDPKAFDQLLYRHERNKNVTAAFEPKDSILWDPQEENLEAKGKLGNTTHSEVLEETGWVQKKTKGR